MTEQSDYASAVPRSTFADTLDQQEAQLEADPLLQRFAESRRALAGDPHRPVYHFVSPESTMNDPNGLCFWQGRWHLFYQAITNPPPGCPFTHWGHAVSDDLVRWRDLPYAIYPDPEQCCYSGAALVEEDRVIAMYHGTRAGNMVAVSGDPLLLNWEKLGGGPVIPMCADDTEEARRRGPDGAPLPYRVHDPCIWKKGGLYYSLSNGTLPGTGGKQFRANFLFRSADLVHWEYLHPFVEGDRFTLPGDDGACPYFWPIGDRYILIFFSHLSGGQYLLGDYDTGRDKFTATAHGRFTFGASTPAAVQSPSVTPDGEGGLIVIFCMNRGKPAQGWDQLMTLPRRLTLSGKEDLAITPAGDIASLRHEHRSASAVKLPANREVVLEGIEGNALEIAAEIDDAGAPVVELCVLRSPGGEETTRIAFFRKRGFRYTQRFAPPPRHCSLITLDTSRSSTLPDAVCRAPETAPVLLEDDEPLRLRVFVDRSVVEVFVNGKQCVAARVYPGREDSVGVSLRAQGRDAQLMSLDAWQMKSTWQE